MDSLVMRYMDMTMPRRNQRLVEHLDRLVKEATQAQKAWAIGHLPSNLNGLSNILADIQADVSSLTDLQEVEKLALQDLEKAK